MGNRHKRQVHAYKRNHPGRPWVGSLHGPAEVTGDQKRGAGTQFRHMVSNIAVTITGNRAAADAYLLVLISKDGNHRSLPPGRYACELIKDDSGQWRFSRRTVFHDHDYTLDGIGR